MPDVKWQDFLYKIDHIIFFPCPKLSGILQYKYLKISLMWIIQIPASHLEDEIPFVLVLSNFLMAKLWCLTIHFHSHREVLYKRNGTRQIRFFLVFRKFTKCIFWSLNKNLTTNTNMNKWTDVKSITHLLSFKALTSDCTQ